MIKPYYEEPNIKIYQGHILEVLKTFNDESVNTIITSPPYWGLRDYGEDTKTIWDGDPSCEHNWETVDVLRKATPGDKPSSKSIIASKRTNAENRPGKPSQFCSKCGAWYGQLGLEPTLDLYISHLLQVTAELKRVLRKDGVMFWNHGDSYGGSATGSLPNPNPNFRSIRTQEAEMEGQEAIKQGPETYKKKYPKCLMLQNFRLILRMIDEQGWILRNDIIWHKKNHMPSSVKDRFSNAYEPIFMFAKQSKPQYYYNIKTVLMADRKAKDPKENIDWEWRPCPRCQKDFLAVAPNGKSTYRKSPVLGPCSRCKGTGKIKHSFWRALDYWFDLDAVRLPHKENSILRVKSAKERTTQPKEERKVDVNIGAIPQRSSLDGIVVDINPSGKNPGDVWKITQDLFQIIVNDKNGENIFKATVPQDELINCFGHWFDGEEYQSNDLWTIPTQPFPEAHFATFPERLINPMILVGCPRRVCKKCGKARIRITKVKYIQPETRGSTKINRLKDKEGYRPKAIYSTEHQTVGWTDCGCNAGWTPGIVLDPFVGAGAVLRVAKNLGYAAIGIDIKEEYCNMAIKGIKNITPSLPFE